MDGGAKAEAIRAIPDATPEQKLLAALLHAVKAARRGDDSEREWLAAHGADVLAFVAPPGVDTRERLRRMVA
jgi:hypothetical protein